MTTSTTRAPPPWRWSLAMTGIGLGIWASAEFRVANYTLNLGGWPTDWPTYLDTIGRVAFSTGAGFGVFVGSIITVWLFSGGLVRQRRQAWIAAGVTGVAALVACWTLSAAIALPGQVRAAKAVRATVIYQDALKERRDAQKALQSIWTAPQDKIALNDRIAATDAEIAKGEPPIEGRATWLDWMLALGQHLLAAGFGAAYRVPIPSRNREGPATESEVVPITQGRRKAKA